MLPERLISSAAGYSHRSFRFASSKVCHCMLLGASGPPRLSGVIWSMTYPGHDPVDEPVDGHGFDFLKSFLACGERAILPLASRWTPGVALACAPVE